MASTAPTFPRATIARTAELSEALVDVHKRINAASASSARDAPHCAHSPLLVAVSKHKPAGDILACYEHGQRDFGENYVQELVDKAQQLPRDIRWHFIGTLQSNKSKMLASIPNLFAIQTLTSIKAADALNKSLPALEDGNHPVLNVFLQVNTSGENSKSGLPPIPTEDAAERTSELYALANHILGKCPRLHLNGLMTIGSLDASLLTEDAPNEDFECLKRTRDTLERLLGEDIATGEAAEARWGIRGSLALSMGMSSDFEAALRAGSNVVRVGTGIFGERHRKSGS